MNKLTILLFIIAIVVSGVGGFILGAQNSQMIPTVNVGNNTTNDSDYSAYDTPKYTKNITTTKKTNTTTVKKNTTTTTPTKPVNNGTNVSSQ